VKVMGQQAPATRYATFRSPSVYPTPYSRLVADDRFFYHNPPWAEGASTGAPGRVRARSIGGYRGIGREVEEVTPHPHNLQNVGPHVLQVVGVRGYFRCLDPRLPATHNRSLGVGNFAGSVQLPSAP
jgi:hypothetical protein